MNNPRTQSQQDELEVHIDDVVAFIEQSSVTPGWSAVIAKRRDIDVEGLTTTFSKELADLYRYEGFDPAYVFGFLVMKARTKEKLVEDVMNMSVAFLLRGNNVSKILSSVSREGSNRLSRLRTTYSLADRLKGNDRRKTITLSRVCMTLPGFIMKAMIDLHKSYVPAIRQSCDKLHCVLRINVCSGYFKESWSESAYYLSFMYAVALGAAIGDSNDTLGSLRRFFKASQDAPTIAEEETRAIMSKWHVNTPPDNWSYLKPQIVYLLSPSFDGRKLKDMLDELDRIMNELIPPQVWLPYIDPRFFRPSTETASTSSTLYTTHDKSEE
nr:TPA_asm: hypothetical protein [Clonorchi Phenuili virus]